MHFTNIRRILCFHMGSVKRIFGSWFSLNWVCIQHSGARSAPLASFYRQSCGAWGSGLCKTCLQAGSGQLLPALQIQALSRVSYRYLVPTQPSLQPAYPPRPPHPASEPSSVVQDESDLIPHPHLQHRGEHVMTVSLPPI